MEKFKPIYILPMSREETYTTEHFEAWQDGDFENNHCSLCRAWHAEQIADDIRYHERREKHLGHDFSTSDHCLNCGSERFEGSDYYLTCTRDFCSDTCQACGAHVSLDVGVCLNCAR